RNPYARPALSRYARRAEYRAMRLLERCGYVCMRSAGSHGAFDVIAIGPRDVRLIQCKAGAATLSPIEREQLAALRVPPNTSVECWTFRDRMPPIIERL